MYGQHPWAVIGARRDEALTHAQVMYSLIKPTKDKEQVESTASMVNVIPQKRIYSLDNVVELEQFMAEMMKRPLVLQPSAYRGHGLAAINCSMCTREEPWLMLINQDHPKVRGKLEMGLSMAKSQIEAQQPFLLKVSFNKYLKQVYLDQLAGETIDSRFFFIEFDGADIVIRYHGPQNEPNWYSFQAKETLLEVEGLLPSEITRRTVFDANREWANSDLRIIRPDELSHYLPGWTFENVDPLEGYLPPPGIDEATGGIEITMGTDDQPNTGRIVGRAKRKANAKSNTYEMPVELHVPNDGGPQVLHGRGPKTPQVVVDYNGDAPAYQDVVRNYSEVASTDRYGHTSRVLYPSDSSSGPNSPHSPHSPHTVGTDRNHTPRTPNHINPSLPRSPGSPRGMYSNGQRSPQPRSRIHQSVPRSPNMPHNSIQDEGRGQYPRNGASPRTPTTPRYDASDRYQTDSELKPSRQTYLTDDNVGGDDGGFVNHSPVSRSPPPHSYNLPSHADTVDRYGNRTPNAPNDRYASPRTPTTPGMMGSPRGQPDSINGHPEHWDQTPPARFPPSTRPVAAPRASVHHQGSGRSDTTNDSGFGDAENGHDSSKHKLMKSAMNLPVKTPYYNHAFQKDSPEKDANVDDIMAKHRAMAAQMLHMNNNSGGQSDRYNDRHNDGSYGRELPRWRGDTNELEHVVEAPEVDFSMSRHGREQEEQVSESFI